MAVMTYKEFDRVCAALPAATKVVQWGGAHVWKVGGKVFAIGGCSNDDWPHITFKCSPPSFDLLTEEPGLPPMPYSSPPGANWRPCSEWPGLSKADLRRYIAQSHRIVAEKLTRALKRELGLEGF